MIKKNILPLFLFLIFLWFQYCDVRDPEASTDIYPEILNISTPLSVASQSQSCYPIYAKVTDPQGIDDIYHVIYALSDTLDAIVMADQGEEGDLIPGDGVYTGCVSVTQIRQTGDFCQLRISVEDYAGNIVTELSDTIYVQDGLPVNPPVLWDPWIADTLEAKDLSQLHFSIKVAASQSSAEIDSLIFQIYPPLSPMPVYQGNMNDSGNAGDEIAGDGCFSLSIDLSDTLTSIGMHQIRYQAWDKAGIPSLPVVVSFFIIGIGDEPVLSDLEAPLSVNRLDPTPVLITVFVSDKQGTADITKVYFNSVKPNGQPSSDNPFILKDDGSEESGDKQAGDSIYSITIRIAPQNALGKYTFTFYAEDHEGHISEPLVHILTVIQEDIN